jgi:hypothetical protein
MLRQLSSAEQSLRERNEAKAEIQAESLIMNHNRMAVYDVVAVLLRTVSEYAKDIWEHNQVPQELDKAIASLLFCTQTLDIEELDAVSKALKRIKGASFTTNPEMVNPLVSPRCFRCVTLDRSLRNLTIRGWTAERLCSNSF